jgi:RNA polymerase sigma factor (sigma-70 family)
VNDINQTSEFAATRWTLVLRAQGDSTEARAALADLCEGYYQPVLRFLRRERRDEEAARELAQEFFSRILARGLGTPDPERGRFRSYVLGALKHFLADLRDREHALKRGGGAVLESLDASADESSALNTEVADASMQQPDTGFDREWALNVMARSLDALKKEMSAPGKVGQFETLKSWLMGDVPGMSQAEAAKRLGITEGAVKVAVHRLRKRFRELVRSEIAQTLRDPALVDEELQHLIAALS